ncbi:MAG: exonuclease domain-containing protein [Bacilli bacterium]|nr:exonuclease domain-containing protein [Bacilli bacterium]
MPIETLKNIREFKGNSLIALDEDYVVFDIETTGLDSRCDEIIEISGVKVKNDEIIDTFSSLIKPINPISSFITELTGITNEMVASAPSVDIVLPKFMEFIGDSILIGHNVNFDINFVYDSLENMGYSKKLTNNFIDTMRISRYLLKNLAHHRLMDLANFYHISYEGAHRSLTDSKITYEVYLKLKEQIINEFGNKEEFMRYNTSKNYGVKASLITPTVDKFDENHPLWHQYVAITGVLANMTRKEAMQSIVDVGGYVEDTVTNRTNYLVLGNNDYNYILKGKKSSKLKKAETMKLEGFPIEIISERVFYEMLNQE